MNIRTFSLAALILAFASGSGVYAQTSTTSDPATGDPAAGDKLKSLDDPMIMKPFVSDEAMSTMRSDDEMKAAWAAMSSKHQKMMRKPRAPNTRNSAARSRTCNSLKRERLATTAEVLLWRCYIKPLRRYSRAIFSN